jgi:hypothetical protein
MCKAHNLSGPTPCCQFASRVTGVEHVSTASASTTPPTATAREAEARKRYDSVMVGVEHERMKGAHLNGRDAMLRMFQERADKVWGEVAASIRATERRKMVAEAGESTPQHTAEYIDAMQVGVMWCRALEEAAPTITPERAVVFAHHMNHSFQRAQEVFKANQLRDEESEYAYNVGVTDGRATEREAAGERVKALRKEHPTWCGAYGPDALQSWCTCSATDVNLTLDRAVSAITNATEGTDAR